MATFLEHFIKTIGNDLILTDKTTRTIRPNPGYLTLNELWNPGLGATAWVNVGNALGTLSAAPVETRTDSLGNTISNKIGTTDSNRVRFITNNTVYGILSTSGVLNLGDQTTIDATSPGANDKLRITSGVLSLKEWVAPPGAPPANSAASGYSKLYPRADGSLYYYNDSLEEFKISPDAGTILTNTDGTGISPRVALWSDSSSPYNSLKGDANLTFSTNVLTVGASSTGRITVNNTANSSPSILINNTSSTAIKTGLQANISNATTTGVGIYSVIAGSGASTNVLFDGAYTSSGSVNYGVLISGEDYNQLSGWLSIGGSHLPETTLHITGASVTTQATNYVAIQKSEVVFSKNTINPRNFKVMYIEPTFNFGGSNSDTNVDILTIDTVNTNVTGLDTLNLIKASYGGIEKFSVLGNGDTTFAGNLNVSGSGSSDFTGNLILRGQSPATGYVLTSSDNNGSTTWTDPATVAQTLISGTPATNQITYFDSSTTITGNSNFIYDGNIVFINNTSNSKMTQGITINQNGNDNEILALQSTDIAHGITTYADTSTYGSFSKFVPGFGGMKFTGFSESETGVVLDSKVTTTDTIKSGSSIGAIHFNTSKKLLTGVTSLGVSENSICFQNNLDTILIIDGNGDIIPATTDSASLGTDDNRFSDLYLGPASIKMGTGGGSPNQTTFTWDTVTKTLTIDHLNGGVTFGDSNTRTGDSSYAFGDGNSVTSDFSFVVGKNNTTVSNITFLTGFGNTIGTTSLYTSILGGLSNSIGDVATSSGMIGTQGSSIGDYCAGCFIGGGVNHVMTDSLVGTPSLANAILGGNINTIGTGVLVGTAIGGAHNIVNADYSIAMGHYAKTSQDGNIVISTGYVSDGVTDGVAFPSTSETAWTLGKNQFLVRATGDGGGLPTSVVFATAVDGAGLVTAGAKLAQGASAWAVVSHKESKENFEEINKQEILSKLANIDIKQWNYKAETTKAKHIGPVAEDFYESFNLGDSNKHISTIDTDGIALVSIQALFDLVQEKQNKIDILETKLNLILEKLESN